MELQVQKTLSLFLSLSEYDWKAAFLIQTVIYKNEKSTQVKSHKKALLPPVLLPPLCNRHVLVVGGVFGCVVSKSQAHVAVNSLKHNTADSVAIYHY